MDPATEPEVASSPDLWDDPMLVDALSAALTTALFEVVGRAALRARGAWRRRLRVARQAIPWVAPVLVAGIRGGWAAVQGGDSFDGVFRGFVSGALAVWIRTFLSTPRKMTEAAEDGPG